MHAAGRSDVSRSRFSRRNLILTGTALVVAASAVAATVKWKPADICLCWKDLPSRAPITAGQQTARNEAPEHLPTLGTIVRPNSGSLAPDALVPVVGSAAANEHSASNAASSGGGKSGSWFGQARSRLASTSRGSSGHSVGFGGLWSQLGFGSGHDAHPAEAKAATQKTAPAPGKKASSGSQAPRGGAATPAAPPTV